MLDKLFSFRGRLNRVEFFCWSLAAGVIFIVMAVVLVVAGVYSLNTRSSPGLSALVIGVAMAIAYFWCGFALQAKRIRDIGLSPVMVIVGLMLFSMFDAAVLSRIFHFKLWSFSPNTGIAGLVNLAYIGMLLFWPGESQDGRLRDLWPDDPDPARPVVPQPSVAPSPSLQPASRPISSRPVFSRLCRGQAVRAASSGCARAEARRNQCIISLARGRILRATA
jgi:uncharacterized membrane protein YhaH (DUF805 family)